MTTWSIPSGSSTSWGTQSKGDTAIETMLLIESTYQLLIDATYVLDIGAAVAATSWQLQTKN